MKKISLSIVYRLLIATALTACAVGVMFFPLKANCQTYKPWDIDVTIRYNNQSWNYRLSDNISGLNNNVISSRGVYRGYNGKMHIVEHLLEQGYSEAEAYCYVLSGVRNVSEKIKSTVNRAAVDATAKFTPNSAQKFSYTQGKDGICVDEIALYKAILNCCGKAQAVVNVPCTTLSAVTVSQLQKERTILGTFTTSFQSSGANRCHNIALAVKSIKGQVLQDGQSFSFNSVVGERTTKRGYKVAKVISNGNYVEGVGGGVCQVSTTLYNAVLLSGLTVNKVCAHSLVPSYVKAGFDAMVSYPSCDLVFTNNTGKTVYIDGYVKDKTVTFTLYGREEKDIKRVRESVEVSRVPFTQKDIVDKVKYPDLIYTDQSKVIVNGSDMVKSSAYLYIYKGDKLLEKRLLRTVTYKMVEKVVAHGDQVRPQVNTDCTDEQNCGQQSTNQHKKVGF